MEETRAVVRKRKKLFVGYVSEDWIFTEIEEIMELAKVDYWKEYVPLYDFMKIAGVSATRKFEKEILKENKCQEMWIYDAPPEENESGNVTEKAWKQYWKRSIHPLCQTCIHECKQSSRVDIFCPSHEEKK